MPEEQTSVSSGAVVEGARKVGQRVEESAAQVQEAAVDRIYGFRSQLESGIDNRRSQVVGRVRQARDALHTASEQIGIGDPAVRDAFDFASDRLGRTADYLSEADLNMLRRDGIEFARRRPGIVIGGALLLGLAAGRALRASASAARDAEFDGGAEREGEGSPERYQRMRTEGRHELR